MNNSNRFPGLEGSVGPMLDQHLSPHVYARDILSGTGKCVCARYLLDNRHIQAAPGIPIVDNTWEQRDPETGWHRRNGHYLELEETDWRCILCCHKFDAAVDAELFICGEKCVHPRPDIDFNKVQVEPDPKDIEFLRKHPPIRMRLDE